MIAGDIEMADEGASVLVRSISRRGEIDEVMRSYLTVAILLSDDESLRRLITNEVPNRGLDEALVREFLSVAEPHEVAKILWSPIGRLISPELFRQVFERNIEATSDLGVLHYLIGAAVDFDRLHPGTTRFPNGHVGPPSRLK